MEITYSSEMVARKRVQLAAVRTPGGLVTFVVAEFPTDPFATRIICAEPGVTENQEIDAMEALEADIRRKHGLETGGGAA